MTNETCRLTNLACNFKPSVVVMLLASVLLAGCLNTAAVTDPRATARGIFNDERLRLTAEYCRIHYGTDSYRLTDPEMIVVHYTAFPTLEESYRFFAPTMLDQVFRRDISGGGQVNVSPHYLIDKDGTILQLAADNVVCRHTIGFNYTAIGIENVGRSEADLTEAQASSTADLISRLVRRHPSIAYLIGHYQYRDAALPHFRLFKEKDPTYRPTDKIDPGPAFMARIRALLWERYGMVLQE
ncbi:MAG TPA: peptidoglycan recognition family protein [Geobacteraceae bacterium]|nr:peptidoglycan recognition family protein [Geobacteraceae bacterium]